MRYYTGYMLKGGRKANFEVRAASKKNAMRNLKDENPGWRIIIVKSYKKAVMP